MKYQESIIQKIVVRWIYTNHPEILFTCAPAVAKSARQGHENRLMGYRKGWPDLFFALPRRSYSGLFIELKTPSGKIQKEQEEVIEYLIRVGYKAVICRSAEEAILTIKEYLQ